MWNGNFGNGSSTIFLYFDKLLPYIFKISLEIESTRLIIGDDMNRMRFSVRSLKVHFTQVRLGPDFEFCFFKNLYQAPSGSVTRNYILISTN
jgi:hypothetical protein